MTRMLNPYENEEQEKRANVLYKLRSCPFCGGTSARLAHTHTPYWWVECECGAEVADSEMNTGPRVAADAWNKRTP